MSEASNGLNNLDPNSNQISWKLGPRDFVLKNIKYIPWIIIGALIGFALAFINIRYSTSIYRVQSSMLIKNDESNARTDRFDALFMSPNTMNLSNEVELLSSRPVLERVIRNMKFLTRYYNIGKIRTSLLYPSSPFKLQIIDSPPNQSLNIHVTILNENQFNLGKESKTLNFGEPFMVGASKVALFRNTEMRLKNYATM